MDLNMHSFIMGAKSINGYYAKFNFLAQKVNA